MAETAPVYVAIPKVSEKDVRLIVDQQEYILPVVVAFMLAGSLQSAATLCLLTRRVDAEYGTDDA